MNIVLTEIRVILDNDAAVRFFKFRFRSFFFFCFLYIFYYIHSFPSPFSTQNVTSSDSTLVLNEFLAWKRLNMQGTTHDAVTFVVTRDLSESQTSGYVVVCCLLFVVLNTIHKLS